jgi:F5/8 type C domain
MNSSLRKRLLSESHGRVPDDGGHLDLGTCATIAFSSEDPDHPIDNLLDNRSGTGGTYWAAAQQDTTEQILIEFDFPQSISRLFYEVEESQRERTQEIRVEVSSDEGRTYRQLVVQEYTFSPRGATLQREDLRLNVKDVNQLRLTIVPHKSGHGTATMTSLRLYP